ncbi:MAG: ATP-binding protein [Pseudomonadota bacterium]
MIFSSVPILAIDLAGSVLMIVLSFLCLHLAFWLKRQEPDNIIWSYLQFLCLGLAGFAISRSAGHILRQILVLSDNGATWKVISPYSGAFNSVMFALVGAVTLFFGTIWRTYRQIALDREALRTAHGELVFLNQNLEQMVDTRTAALSRSERRYRRIFEISRDVILVTDALGDILDLNPLGMTTFAGMSERETPAGKNFGSFFCKPKDWDAVLRDITSEGFVISKELLLRRLDGRTLHALISGSLDPATDGEPATIHFLVKDIEQLRQMEKQMAQADKLASIGELSAGIAHEINNPLGVILGYTQLLLRKETGDDERREDLKIIEKHVRNCKTIVEDLLNFARSSPTVRELADINVLVEDVVTFITHHAKMGKTTLAAHYDRQLPRIRIDDKKIRQVVINLVMNALYAVGGSGSIRIDTELAASENRAVISVSDDGPGIDPVHLPRVFDPFYTTKPTGEGTGLGLSVSYGIITNHGGDIQVESVPGQGTVFRVSLPLASDS